MELAYIGLGANLGNTKATLQQAVDDLGKTPGISNLRLSSFYRTTPVDASGPDYLNAVAELQTTLPPLALLHRLQCIEQTYGRERPYRNAPRTLDMDLLWFGGKNIDSPELTVPHPRMHERAFVLVPLIELAPNLCLAQGSLAALLQQCCDKNGVHLVT